MKDLSKFIRTIRDIGFVKSDYFKNSLDSLSYSYNDYHISIGPVNYQREIRWSIFLNHFVSSKQNGWLSFGDNNQRNFDLDEIDLLKDIFKSEFRDSKIKKLGI